MHYALPDTLLTRIGDVLRLHAQNRLKRKKQETEQTSSLKHSTANTSVKSHPTVATSVSKVVKSSAIDDIYGDIFEGIGMSSTCN